MTGPEIATATALPSVRVLSPVRHRDARGFFSEVWRDDALAREGISCRFVQENHARSAASGTVRGLHFQIGRAAQAKLVRCPRGSIFDVAVDIRHGSPTFGRHVSCVLSVENWSQIWVPVGFAHGFCTLEPDTEVIYKVTAFYAPQCDKGVAFDDPDIGIAWPVPRGELVLSDKDERHPRLRDLPAAFTYAAS